MRANQNTNLNKWNQSHLGEHDMGLKINPMFDTSDIFNNYSMSAFDMRW